MLFLSLEKNCSLASVIFSCLTWPNPKKPDASVFISNSQVAPWNLSYDALFPFALKFFTFLFHEYGFYYKPNYLFGQVFNSLN